RPIDAGGHGVDAGAAEIEREHVALGARVLLGAGLLLGARVLLLRARVLRGAQDVEELSLRVEPDHAPHLRQFAPQRRRDLRHPRESVYPGGPPLGGDPDGHATGARRARDSLANRLFGWWL